MPNGKSIVEEGCTETDDGVRKEPNDGMYKKILHVKPFSGKTITSKYDPQNTVDRMKEQIERKTNPKGSAASRESRKSPEEQPENRKLQHKKKKYDRNDGSISWRHEKRRVNAILDNKRKRSKKKSVRSKH